MPAFRTDARPQAALAVSGPRLEFAQKAFITDRGRLLLVRKSASDPHHPGRWEVPGGRLEVTGDLDLDEHIRREVWEEVGLRVEPGPPFHLWQWFMPDRHGRRSRAVRVVAAARRCRPLNREITLENQTPGDHLTDAAWVPLAEIASYDLIPSLRPVMRAFMLMHPEAAAPPAAPGAGRADPDRTGGERAGAGRPGSGHLNTDHLAPGSLATLNGPSRDPAGERAQAARMPEPEPLAEPFSGPLPPGTTG